MGNATATDAEPRVMENITALGRKVTEFEKLETFPRPPHLRNVILRMDEVTATCPVTGQPDYYTIDVVYTPEKLCVESKCVKLYFQQYRNRGLFCEAFTSQIAADFAEALGVDVHVVVRQKSRGGVAIEAVGRAGVEKPKND